MWHWKTNNTHMKSAVFEKHHNTLAFEVSEFEAKRMQNSLRSTNPTAVWN